MSSTKVVPNYVGVKFVLWGRKYQQFATAQVRIDGSSGYVLIDEVGVVVTEQRNDVPGMFGDGKFIGLKAISEDGRVFSRNWESYPDDAKTGATSHWYLEEKPEEAPRAYLGYVDAVQASSVFYRSIGGQTYDSGGLYAIPTGSKVCPRHGDTFLKEQECESCRVDSLFHREDEVVYASCPFCEATRDVSERETYRRDLHIKWDHPQQYLSLTSKGTNPADWKSIAQT
jgi:hypothetical protein